SVGDMGLRVPVWDIAKRFRNAIEVTTLEQARDLARTLGKNRVCLIRGSGYIVTGRTINDLVRLSAYVPRNGRAIMDATPFGKLSSSPAGERAGGPAIDRESNAMRRGWEYWARQAGCDELLPD